MSEVKKILVLAHDFPPVISIAAQRPYSWYKLLPNHGFCLTVVAYLPNQKSKNNNYTTSEKEIEISGSNKIIRVPVIPNLRDRLMENFGPNRFVLLRKMLSFFYSFFEFLFFAFDSKRLFYRCALEELNQTKYDLIIATGEPFILFRYASILSKKFNVPWVADYRDGWTTNQGGYKRGLLFRLLNGFYQIMERKYVNTAAFLTTAAPSYKTAIQKNLPLKNIYLIFNGYTEEATPAEVKNTRADFRIGYAGTIYPYQKVDTFFEGLSLFIQAQKNPNLKVFFWGVGSPEPSVLQKLKEYQAMFPNFVELTPKLSHAEVLKELVNCNLLLLLSAPHVDTLAAKLFDYLALKRKVILVEDDQGIMHSIMKETNAGIMCKNAEEVKEVLETEYTEFKKGNIIKVQPITNETKYSRTYQTARFAQLIKENL
jgi:glycosyltransferase involved in cell wall biosynthesis